MFNYLVSRSKYSVRFTKIDYSIGFLFYWRFLESKDDKNRQLVE
jgi:hypothetical protein